MDHRPVELVEVGQLVEQRGDRNIGEVGHASRLRRPHDPRSGVADPPDLRRGGEPETHRCARCCPCSPAAGGRATGCSWSTTAGRTERARSPTGWRPRSRGRGAAPRRARGLGPAYLAGLRVRAGAGAGLLMEIDTDFSHDPADVERLAVAAVADGADLALGSRYVDGGGVSDWGLLRSERQPRRLAVRAGRPRRPRVRDLTGGFKCFRREVLEAIDLPTVRSKGYAFQVELTYRALHAGFKGRRGPDRLPRPRARPVEDELAHRPGGDVVLLPPHASGGRKRAGASCRSPGGDWPRARRRPRLGGHPRHAGRRGTARRCAVLRGWVAGERRRSPSRCSRRWWAVGDPHHARRRACSSSPASTATRRPATPRRSSWAQPARPRAPRARLRGRVHRQVVAAGSRPRTTRARGAWIHDRAGVGRDRVRRRRDRLLARGRRRYALGGTLATLAPQLGTTPAMMLLTVAAARAPRAHVRCSSRSARGSSRHAPGRLAPAARGDVRDDRDRAPGARLSRRSSRSGVTPAHHPGTSLRIVEGMSRSHTTSLTTTSRRRCSRTSSPCSSTSGPPGAGRAGSSLRSSRRSPQSSPTSSASSSSTSTRTSGTAAQFGVMSIPTMILFKNGQAGQDDRRRLPEARGSGRARAGARLARTPAPRRHAGAATSSDLRHRLRPVARVVRRAVVVVKLQALGLEPRTDARRVAERRGARRDRRP